MSRYFDVVVLSATPTEEPLTRPVMAQIGLLNSILGFNVFCDFAQAIGVSESPQEISIRLHGPWSGLN